MKPSNSESNACHPEHRGKPTGIRFCVLGMLCAMSFILYLDRVCMGQAVKPIKDELGISDAAMGYILGAFTLAYGLFEIPAGHWGDRYGSRGVLTRIVLWWSAFTMLTGAAHSVVWLFIIRFLFGAGEAGALPNAARVISRWFPPGKLGPAQGTIMTAALVGGAISPVIAQFLIRELGWRWTFVTLGLPGIGWALIFHAWYRDDPDQHSQVNADEIRLINSGRHLPTAAPSHPKLPWKRVLTSQNVWLLGLVATCASASTYMVFSWYPTYLQEGRSVSGDNSAWLASLVLAGGALGSVTGGWLSDRLVSMTGDRRWTRRGMGIFLLITGGLALLVSIHCDSPGMAAVCCSYTFFAIHAQLAAWWGVVTEISGRHLGALFGFMNSMGVVGAFSSQVFLGSFVDWLARLGRTGRAQWDPAFWIYAGILILGGCLWCRIDANQPVVESEG